MEKWHGAWREGGAEALRSRGPHGRPRLDEAQVVELVAELEAGPAAYGYAAGQRWTLGRVAELIWEKFGISYTGAGVWLLLRRAGCSWQVAGRRAAGRDERAIEAWKGQVWPQVKEPRRPREHGSAPGTRQARASGRRRDARGAGAGIPR